VILNGYEEEEGVNWLELESLLWWRWWKSQILNSYGW